MTLSPTQLLILASLDQYLGDPTRSQIFSAMRRVSPQPYLEMQKDLSELRKLGMIQGKQNYGQRVRITQAGRAYVAGSIPTGETSMLKHPFTPKATERRWNDDYIRKEKIPTTHSQ